MASEECLEQNFMLCIDIVVLCPMCLQRRINYISNISLIELSIFFFFTLYLG